MNPIRDVRLAAHVPTINGAVFNVPVAGVVPPRAVAVPARSIRSDDGIRTLIEAVNRIYFPYGIRFLLDAAIDRAGVLNFVTQGS